MARPSAVDQVAMAATAMVMRGELRPGAALRKATLAEGFGVSRNTVREALQILEASRLITRHPHRGAVVSHFEPDDVRDLYEIRRIVELAGIDHAKPGALLDNLRQAFTRLERAADHGNWREIVETGHRFSHRARGPER